MSRENNHPDSKVTEKEWDALIQGYLKWGPKNPGQYLRSFPVLQEYHWTCDQIKAKLKGRTFLNKALECTFTI